MTTFAYRSTRCLFYGIYPPLPIGLLVKGFRKVINQGDRGDLKVVSNENGGGSGMRQMIGIGLRPW